MPDEIRKLPEETLPLRAGLVWALDTLDEYRADTNYERGSGSVNEWRPDEAAKIAALRQMASRTSDASRLRDLAKAYDHGDGGRMYLCAGLRFAAAVLEGADPDDIDGL